MTLIHLTQVLQANCEIMNLSNKIQTTNCTWKVVPTYLANLFLPDLLPFVHIQGFICFYYQYLTWHLFFSYSLYYFKYGRCSELHPQRYYLVCSSWALGSCCNYSMGVLYNTAPQKHLPDYTDRPWPFSPWNSVSNILAARYSVVLVSKHLRTF